MKNNLVEALIGAVVLIVAGLFVAYTYASTDIGGVSGTPYKASFLRADGLTVGADVRMSGVKVGTVTEQALDPRTFKALVTFTVDDDIVVPADSSVRIKSEGLLGGNYLDVVPGGLDEQLEAGDEFQFAEPPVDLMSLLNQAIFSATGGGGSDDESNDGN